MITLEQKGTLQRYADIKILIKNLEEEQDTLNPQVMEIMNENEVDELKTEQGKFCKSSRRKWKYSDDLQAREDNLKDSKKIEEQTGVAEYTENFFVVFKGAK